MHPSSSPIDSGALMCGQRSSVATIPAGRVGEQDVEVAAGDPSHRPRGQLGQVEDGLERGPGASEGRERGSGTGRDGRPSAECYPGDERRPRWATGAVECEEERRSVAGDAAPRPARALPTGAGAIGDRAGRDRGLVRGSERDLLDRHRGDCSATIEPITPEPERLGGREAERPVDALDHRAG